MRRVLVIAAILAVAASGARAQTTINNSGMSSFVPMEQSGVGNTGISSFVPVEQVGVSSSGLSAFVVLEEVTATKRSRGFILN